MTSRFALSSTSCFTTMTTLGPESVIAQSSATLLSHTYSPGATLAVGVPYVRGSSLENLLHIVLHRRVTEATSKCEGTAAAAQRSFLLHHKSLHRRCQKRSKLFQLHESARQCLSA